MHYNSVALGTTLTAQRGPSVRTHVLPLSQSRPAVRCLHLQPCTLGHGKSFSYHACTSCSSCSDSGLRALLHSPAPATTTLANLASCLVSLSTSPAPPWMRWSLSCSQTARGCTGWCLVSAWSTRPGWLSKLAGIMRALWLLARAYLGGKLPPTNHSLCVHMQGRALGSQAIKGQSRHAAAHWQQ